MACKAHLDRSGQMVCVPCGLQWDADDPSPPECVNIVIEPLTVTKHVNKEQAQKANLEIHKNVGRKHIKQILEDLK